MRVRQWLLTGTSLAVFTFMPGAVMAQQAEYQALQQAQASGDQGAVDAAQQAFLEACIASGYSNIDECVAAVAGGAATTVEATPVEERAPVEEPAPAVEEPAPPVEEPAPAPEP